VRKPKEKGPLGRPRRRRGIILKWVLIKSVERALTDMPSYRDKWRVVVISVMNLWVPQNAGIS
jgi:hypothetical protein